MTIEASQYINQLNSSFPRSTDLLKEGDDHIRMIKANLKSTFPNFTGSISISSNSLNSLNNTMDFSASGVKINAPFSVKDGVGVNLGANQALFNSGKDYSFDKWNPKMGINWETLVQLFQNVLYPVGAVWCSGVNNVNPNQFVLFTGTTWVPWALGRTLVGVGQEPGLGVNLAHGQQVGTSSNTLSTNQMPAHAHSMDQHQHIGTTSPNGAHNHSLEVGSGGNQGNVYRLNQALHVGAVNNSFVYGVGDHTHVFTTEFGGAQATYSSGGGQAVNNIQPSVGVGYWLRTS